MTNQLTVVGLFAGIGGFELGLNAAGHGTLLVSEIAEPARRVLRARFADVPLVGDIRSIRALPRTDLVVAGFPCQDLSLAGTQHGLEGERSGLVREVLRLVRRGRPGLVLLENVLYFIKRQHGRLVRSVTDELEHLGYRWAYRVVDTRGFGIPQRRQRVILLASRGEVDPATVLFRRSVESATDDRLVPLRPRHAYGFYWTEGKRAIGWAPQAVPTIKGGSGLGIPSPPAIFVNTTGQVGTPTVSDGERLQGFEPDWTAVPDLAGWVLRDGVRWGLVGNAVSVPVANWIGHELSRYTARQHFDGAPLEAGRPMPMSAASDGNGLWTPRVSMHVQYPTNDPIMTFLAEPLRPLSVRALRGFLRRASQGSVRYPDGFIPALRAQACASAA